MDYSDFPVFLLGDLLRLEHVLNTALVTIALLIWYRYFWTTINWKQDYLDSYDDFGEFRTNSWRKAHAINEARRNRRFTDFPDSYPNGWYIVMDSYELKKNQAKEVHILGQNLVIWRGESGTAYMSDAYCPHLGAHLGVGGKVNGECIKCPFHEWEYDGSCDGQLAKIPYSKTTLKGVKLQMKRILEKDGVIYIWYHSEDHGPNWTPKMPKEFHSMKMRLRGKFEFKTTGCVQDIVENLMDGQHFVSVHKFPKSEVSWSRVKGEGNEHLSRFYFNPHLEFCGIKFPAHLEGQLQGAALYMGVVPTFLGTYVHSVTVNGIDPLVTTFTMRIYTNHYFFNPIDLFTLLAEYYIVRQDVGIWNRKGYWKSLTLPKEDESIKSGRNWYKQFYSEAKLSKDLLPDERDADKTDDKNNRTSHEEERNGKANGISKHSIE